MVQMASTDMLEAGIVLLEVYFTLTSFRERALEPQWFRSPVVLTQKSAHNGDEQSTIVGSRVQQL
jgi:hypothetical protein